MIPKKHSGQLPYLCAAAIDNLEHCQGYFVHAPAVTAGLCPLRPLWCLYMPNVLARLTLSLTIQRTWAAGEHGVGADHWHIPQLLWRPDHHWGSLQVLGPPPQLWPQHLLHHLHPGAGAPLHAHLGVPWRLETAGLLTSGVVFIYCAWILWSALSSEPSDARCTYYGAQKATTAQKVSCQMITTQDICIANLAA